MQQQHSRQRRTFQSPEAQARAAVWAAAARSATQARPAYCTRAAWACDQAYRALAARGLTLPHAAIVAVVQAALPRRVDLPVTAAARAAAVEAIAEAAPTVAQVAQWAIEREAAAPVAAPVAPCAVEPAQLAPIAVEPIALASLTVAQLRALAGARGVALPTRALKAAIVAAIVAGGF